jgi:methylmalonyl-CoA mutase N-terminal domain/subunit
MALAAAGGTNRATDRRSERSALRRPPDRDPTDPARGRDAAGLWLQAFKAGRDARQVEAALNNIRAAALGRAFQAVSPEISNLKSEISALHSTNIMPALIDGALANCTLGEMVQALADIYGRYSGEPEW